MNECLNGCSLKSKSDYTLLDILGAEDLVGTLQIVPILKKIKMHYSSMKPARGEKGISMELKILKPFNLRLIMNPLQASVSWFRNEIIKLFGLNFWCYVSELNKLYSFIFSIGYYS